MREQIDKKYQQIGIERGTLESLLGERIQILEGQAQADAAFPGHQFGFV